MNDKQSPNPEKQSSVATNHLNPTEAVARGQGFSATMTHFYEHPSDNSDIPEVWCYTDQPSYEPGEEVSFCVSTTANTFDLEVIRDGAYPESVFQTKGNVGIHHPTPPRAYAEGCNWPTSITWSLPSDLRSGGYVVLTSIEDKYGEKIEQQHFFIVRAGQQSERAPLVLIVTTATWVAYNDWGGSNAYEGIDGEASDQFSPTLSLERPWSKGFIWLPEGAPRIPNRLPPNSIPRYPNIEFAFSQGFAKYYAAAGWATYERNFVCWAQQQGIEFDVISQYDLHNDPNLLTPYQCAVIVGHDEYWSRDMRDNLDNFIDKGGNLARFGGNFCWQIRLEDGNQKQVCYKYRARDEDPVMGTDQQAQLTSAWEDSIVNYPGASTMGLNGFAGVYVGVGATMPRSQRGFTVYRSDHWAFENTDLYFGDIFGEDAGIYGFEVDGVDFTFTDGLPYPTHSDGAPDSLNILAMAPATLVEEDHGHRGAQLYLGDADAIFAASVKHGSVSTEAVNKVKYGAGMIATFTRGAGQVFNAASCEWIVGLKAKDFHTETITLNVLRRFAG